MEKPRSDTNRFKVGEIEVTVTSEYTEQHAQGYIVI